MAKSLSNLDETHEPTNPGSLRNSKKDGNQRTTPRHIIIKLSKAKNKENTNIEDNKKKSN